MSAFTFGIQQQHHSQQRQLVIAQHLVVAEAENVVEIDEGFSAGWEEILLIGKLMIQRPHLNLRYLQRKLPQLWHHHVQGTFDIVPLGYDFFLFSFTDPNDLLAVLSEGPWEIADQYLLLQRWTPGFYPATAMITRTAVWVRIRNLPLEYWSWPVLQKLATALGKPIKTDEATENVWRGTFARVCVEVELLRPAIHEIQIESRGVVHVCPVTYENVCMLCRVCGRAGHHLTLDCKDKPKLERCIIEGRGDPMLDCEEDEPELERCIINGRGGGSLGPSILSSSEDSPSAPTPVSRAFLAVSDAAALQWAREHWGWLPPHFQATVSEPLRAKITTVGNSFPATADQALQPRLQCLPLAPSQQPFPLYSSSGGGGDPREDGEGGFSESISSNEVNDMEWEVEVGVVSSRWTI